ncbi:RluA family pseudouridine synthase [Bdellovibrio sp. qaytius]|nr:RluA family pseudouridine synthase [Bdellovibrio sp. qaytius]
MLKKETQIHSQGFEYGVKHFNSPKSGDLSEIITDVLTLPTADVDFLIQLGSVYVSGKRAEVGQQVLENTHIRVHTKPRRYNVNYDWKSRIVFEHQDFVVLNKPNNIPSHPSVDNQIENSLTQLSLAIGKKLFITHRLDTLTEGLIVYGKNSEFVNGFNIQLQKKLITKKYVALVETTEKLPNHLVHYMEPSPRAPKKVSQVATEGWDFCELKIEQQKILDRYSWIKINLLTGRTHQIRSQVSEVGAPIVGDKQYGSQILEDENKIALRAQEIEFQWQNQSHHIKISEDFE